MTAAAMLKEARADLGVTGRPNPITREYAARHGSVYLFAPWCNMSITHWARRSGNAAAVLPDGDRAYTVWHAEDGKRLGRWHAGTAANIRRYAVPGSIVFFDWDGTDVINRIDHVGVVEVNLGHGRIQTIEGNTANACKRRVRGPAVIAGFWTPDYEEDEVDVNDIWHKAKITMNKGEKNESKRSPASVLQELETEQDRLKAGLKQLDAKLDQVLALLEK
ncbi:CHAP domain-containing protein [Nonomuraea fuscirosea]|uniref:CHAP domain-containing protein n=1 Tax=Nonomuraea fuscirosea TaxID=1291556 RepID=UPI0033ED4ECF